VTNSLQECAITDILLSAAQEVFSSMLGIEIQQSEGAVNIETPFDGVLSVIGLTGAWMGSGFLRSTDKVACDLASRFLMTEAAAVNDEVLDAAGEVTNMIIGSAKNVAEEQLGAIQMSVPTVVYGKNLSTRAMRSELQAPLTCTYSGGRFLLGICLAKR